MQINKEKEDDTGWRSMIITGSADFPDLNHAHDDDDIWIGVQQICHVYSTRVENVVRKGSFGNDFG